MKKAKYAYWEYTYWTRNVDSEIKVYSCSSRNYPRYYLDNVSESPNAYTINLEEVWYSMKDAHLEANDILKNQCKDDPEYNTADMVCICVTFFNKKPKIEDNGFIGREGYKYKVGEKYFIYSLGGFKNGS